MEKQARSFALADGRLQTEILASQDTANYAAVNSQGSAVRGGRPFAGNIDYQVSYLLRGGKALNQ